MKRKRDSQSRPTGFKPEFQGQHPDESVVLVVRQHPVVLRKELIIGMLIILLGILPAVISPLSSWVFKFFGIAILIALVYWFYHWVGWFYSVYIVTDQRLIDIRQKGFFNRKVSEVGFDKVQSINYHIKGFEAAVLGFGDITVQTYTGPWVMQYIHHPDEVHSEMMAVTHTVTSTPPIK